MEHEPWKLEYTILKTKVYFTENYGTIPKKYYEYNEKQWSFNMGFLWKKWKTFKATGTLKHWNYNFTKIINLIYFSFIVYKNVQICRLWKIV